MASGLGNGWADRAVWRTLVLSGLTDLTPEVAAALADCPGVVDLSGLRTLNVEAARMLQAYRGPQLDLSRVHPIPPHVIELGREVPLRLDAGSIRRWRQLTVAEADGSLDDFILPDHLEKRP